MNARAVASEQLSGQIVDSLTAGLLVVDDAGRVEILNPAGRRLLDVSEESPGADYRELLAKARAAEGCGDRVSDDRDAHRATDSSRFPARLGRHTSASRYRRSAPIAPARSACSLT